VSTVQSIINSIEIHVRDPDNREITGAQLLTLVNDAVEDLKTSGVVLPLEDDESLTFLANTYEYNVPASFLHVQELLVENTSTTPSTWDERVPKHFWEMRIDAAVPKFFIHRGYALPTAQRMKVVGQKALTVYSDLTDTVDPGVEAYLRERAAAFALGFMSAGQGELDRYRQGQSEIKYRNSEILRTRLSPQEFRILPDSQKVPGRA
jgi:hypothetical protein